MAPGIFLTGVTGYIGGDVFYELYKAHPEFEYTLLVRNEERGRAVAEAYPKVRLVYGTLDDADVIQKEAAAADIVIHTAESADNVPSARAIAKGIGSGHSKDRPGYWVHLCGTGILMFDDQQKKRYGQPPLPGQKYNDVEDIDRILNLPDDALHRDVDKIVLEANSYSGVRTAILAPPCIYGNGRGPGNQRSQQVYDMVKYMLHHGYAPVVETGKTEWDNVHIRDLAKLFVLLVEAALDPSKNQDPEIFGGRAYYFAEHGVHSWGEVARWIAEEAYKQGYMAEVKVEKTTMEAIAARPGFGSPSWALNSKSVAVRAAKYLGWKPVEKSLHDEVPEVVTGEAKRMGISPTGPKHPA